jgi:hypothetical protein
VLSAANGIFSQMIRLICGTIYGFLRFRRNG